MAGSRISLAIARQEFRVTRSEGARRSAYRRTRLGDGLPRKRSARKQDPEVRLSVVQAARDLPREQAAKSLTGAGNVSGDNCQQQWFLQSSWQTLAINLFPAQ